MTVRNKSKESFTFSFDIKFLCKFQFTFKYLVSREVKTKVCLKSFMIRSINSKIRTNEYRQYSQSDLNSLPLVFLAIFSSLPVKAKLIKYELTATKNKINISGNKTVNFALMLNGNIPGPTLEFTEGDEAEIVVRNEIPDEELSIHWHGILLDPYMDGVP